MIPLYHPHSSDRAFGERQAHMLRVVGDYGRLVGYRLAAEDHHRDSVAYAERERCIVEAGLQPYRTAPFVTSLRRTTGLVLIRAGERLRGSCLPSPTSGGVPVA